MRLLFTVIYSLWSAGRWTPSRSQHSWCNPKRQNRMYSHNLFQWKVHTCEWAALSSQYLRTAHFGDDLPGFIENRQPLGFRRVSTGQTATQRPKQQVLERRRRVSFEFKHSLLSDQHITAVGVLWPSGSRPHRSLWSYRWSLWLWPQQTLAWTPSWLNSAARHCGGKKVWSLQWKRKKVFHHNKKPLKHEPWFHGSIFRQPSRNHSD